MFFPNENFVLISFKFLPRATLHETAMSFWSQVSFTFHGLPGFPWVTALSLPNLQHLLIPPLLIPCLPIPVLFCNFPIGTRCLSHCPKALISSHNIHRKERGSIFCFLFRYPVSYTGFIFRKSCDA